MYYKNVYDIQVYINILSHEFRILVKCVKQFRHEKKSVVWHIQHATSSEMALKSETVTIIVMDSIKIIYKYI